jgi:NAD(P)-dependent dehydrogenase (short-subunit alcohol dehydrogenase family)
MDSFSGKLAVVTGGGSGMGRELVRQLAAQGCSVAACDVNADAVAQTARIRVANRQPARAAGRADPAGRAARGRLGRRDARDAGEDERRLPRRRAAQRGRGGHHHPGRGALGAWRILVGQDAINLDAAVRARPEDAYDYPALASMAARNADDPSRETQVRRPEAG